MEQALKRQKYDTFIIWLYNQGKEQVLPKQFRQTIPCSTITGWRKIDFSSYTGSAFRAFGNDSFTYHELLLKHQNLKKILRVITKVWINVSDMCTTVLTKSREHSELLIDQVHQLFTALPKHIALKISGLSFASYYDRLSRIKVHCGISPLDLCVKRHPLQLSVREIKKIKDLFNESQFYCWPGVSMYYYALKNRGLFISLSTFYKYVNLLGLKRVWRTKPTKTKGLETSAPNQYLHVDTTFWALGTGHKAAIVFVSDNFSKAILGWSMSTQHSAKNVIQALHNAILTIQNYHPGHTYTVLVADGGGENHATSMEELLSKIKQPEITKRIAQKDLCFSNSPVEAINKIIKRYLRHYNPQTEQALQKVLHDAVVDYNEYRPHGSLGGLQPMQMYRNPTKPISYREQISRAKNIRIEENRRANCSGCLKE